MSVFGLKKGDNGPQDNPKSAGKMHRPAPVMPHTMSGKGHMPEGGKGMPLVKGGPRVPGPSRAKKS